ncbi:MAG: flagellar biosynthesis anti-sigma factor FlgM [Bdellovibrionales bacterium]|jgi:negative regulator of flagellin synthesis FlgM|nr:flagellar biosynthesis anti-sigma factor FlgM [Bdellovibrionales bacterium]
MKVTNSGPGNIAAPTTGADTTKSAREGRTSRSAASEAFGASVGSSAKVDVSPRAQELKRVKEMSTPTGDVDEAKVARLQALIDSGQYKVDAGAIAERLLGEQLKMNEK